MTEELKPTDEQCDRLVALTMDKLAAKGCDQYGDIHALDLNPNIMEHHSLRRSIVRTAYMLGGIEAQAAPDAQPEPAAPDPANSYARSLAVALHASHYPEVTQWRPFDDTLGLLTQIDNMTCSLVRPAAAPTVVEPVAWMFDRRYGRGLTFVKPATYTDEDGKLIEPVPLYLAATPPRAPTVVEPPVGWWVYSQDGAGAFWHTKPDDEQLEILSKECGQLVVARPLQLAATPPRAALTDEQIDRHSLKASECPPDSKVMLVSSIRRLLAGYRRPE